MRNLLYITLTVVLSAYMLVISSSINVSHVQCSQGEQWVIGTEMPPCAADDVKTCPFTKKACHKTSKEESPNRKKDSINLAFEFIANNSADQKFEIPLITPAWKIVAVQHDQVKSLKLAIESEANRSHSQADLSNPDLTMLQVFLI